MYHIPIVETNDNDYMIEFCHINSDAKAGDWKKENIISLQNIKINIFMEGEFSVFSDGKNYRPSYGDICVLPPYKMHYGQIPKPTHTDYYQLDIGIKAFDLIPKGKELLEKIIEYSNLEGAFFRPTNDDVKRIIYLCNRIEDSIGKGNKALAFAKTVEIISKLNDMYINGGKVATFLLSPAVKNTIEFLEDNFDKNITIYDIAKKQELSESYLSRLFKKEVGIGIHEYQTKYRITKASYLLLTHTVAETCYLCGFSDSSHFISVFKRYFDCTPMQYKKDK